MDDPFGLRSLDVDALRRKRCAKWAAAPVGGYAAWIADMDFPVAPAIREALRDVIEGDEFGYPDWGGVYALSPASKLFPERMRTCFGWDPMPDRLHDLANVIQGVRVTIDLLSQPGDGVVLHMPAYHPFLDTLRTMDRRLVSVEPTGDGFDYDRLEADLSEAGATVWILCHPHNPLGHVFDEAELRRVAEIAERHGIVVISDEVHADLTLAPECHVPFASLGPDVEARDGHDHLDLEGVQPGRHALGGAARRRRRHGAGAGGAAQPLSGGTQPDGGHRQCGRLDAWIGVARRRCVPCSTRTAGHWSICSPSISPAPATALRRRPTWRGSISAAPAWATTRRQRSRVARRRGQLAAHSSGRKARVTFASTSPPAPTSCPARCGRRARAYRRDECSRVLPALAITAGMVATVNPCGFALLPAYLGAFVGLQDRPTKFGAVGRAFAVSAVLTAGFITVFGLLGIVFSSVLEEVQHYAPWFTIVFGLIVVAAGIYLLSGRGLVLALPKLERGGSDGTLLSMYLFGVSYAVASLSCAIGPFLVVTSSVSNADSYASRVMTFVVYGIGMGLVITVLTVALALARASVVTRFRELLPVINRIAGGLMVVTGLYVAYYGYYELRLLNYGGDEDDAVIDAALRIQTRMQSLMPNAGNYGWYVLGAVALLTAAGLWAALTSRSGPAPDGVSDPGPIDRDRSHHLVDQ